MYLLVQYFVTVLLQPSGELAHLEITVLFIIDEVIRRVLGHQALRVEYLIIIFRLYFLVYEEQMDVLVVNVVKLELGGRPLLCHSIKLGKFAQSVAHAEHLLIVENLDELAHSRSQFQVLLYSAVAGDNGAVFAPMPREH